MAVKAKQQTNGSKAEQPAVTEPETATETELQVEASVEDDREGELEPAEPSQAPTEVGTSGSAEEEVDSETVTTESAAVDTDLAATPIAAPTHLNKQEAIAQLNTANHDLVTLLEPLLTSAVTQKRLVELMVRQIGLTPAEGEAWLAFVKQFLETKRKASQSLVRSLIDQA